MNHIRRACQLKTVFLILVVLILAHSGGCSFQSKKKASSEYVEKTGRADGLPVVEPIPQWLNVDPRFAPRDREGDPYVHAFFDFLPFPENKDHKINFVSLVPVGSKFAYGLDIHSGQIYKKYNLCPQDDVWKSYKGTISSPPYTEGFVPRILDQLGEPLKIIVYGGSKYFPEFSPVQPLSQRVKVVGGVIEQYCEYYPCAFRDQWRSRLVLIAVNHKDPKFQDVDSLTDLKKKVNWDKLKAYMENMGGRLVRGKDQRPAYRISGSIPAEEAFDYALKKGHQFKYDELVKLRQGCHKLYDHMWRGAEQLRKNIKLGRIKENTSQLRSESLVVDINKSIFKDDLEEAQGDIVGSDEPIEGFRDFDDYFLDFYHKFGGRYLTCHKFVRVSSVRRDIQRHWFFSYITAFMQLERLGYVYHCPKRAWIKNSYLANGKRQFDQVEMKKGCQSEDLERSFDNAITILQGLRKSHLPHYFYKQYDHGIGASHQRIYSWIFSTGKVSACKAEIQSMDDEDGFPEDVSWKPFHPYTL